MKDIAWIDLLTGILLMIIPLFVMGYLKSKLMRATFLATIRMCAQLLLMGVYFRYLFAWDIAWLNVLWVLLMVLVASYTFIDRTGLKLKVLLLPCLIAFLVSGFLIGLHFLYFVLHLENPFEAQYFIPIMGLLLGNMLTVNVVALSTYYQQLNREQQLYYYLIGNGATRFEATRSFLREAIEKSFSPCIANVAVMGIVSLPGTMIGQILGGSDPDIAIKYQIMIVAITVSASMLSVLITVFLASFRSFDRFHRIRSNFVLHEDQYGSMEMF